MLRPGFVFDLFLIAASLTALALAEQPVVRQADIRDTISRGYLPLSAASRSMEISQPELIDAPLGSAAPLKDSPCMQKPMQNGVNPFASQASINSDESSGNDSICCPPWGLLKNRACRCLFGGCLCGHGQYDETPFGALVHAHMKTQVCNAMADGLVLYQYDFCNASPVDSSKLNPSGEKSLYEIAGIMQSSDLGPLVIQCTPGNPKLDAARRNYVLKKLHDSNFAIPDEWVVVGKPNARGMSGPQALKVKGRMNKELIAPDNEKNAVEINPFSTGTNGLGGGAGVMLPVMPMGGAPKQ
ncbi:MAG: hypothetical protein ACWGMZ_05100 [Thermoguttaceae bacterium]